MKSNKATKTIDSIAKGIGRGIVSGAVGITAMILSQTLEKHFFGKTTNQTSIEVACKVLGLKPANEKSKARFNKIIQWSYGSAWGVFRSLLGSLNIKGPEATALHFGAIGANLMLVLPALGLVRPVSEWDKEKMAVEMGHHALYVIVVGLVYDTIDVEA